MPRRLGTDFDNLFIGKKGPHHTNPAIPKPEHKEEPVVELLEHPSHEQHLPRTPLMHKPKELFYARKMSELYGTMRSPGGWRYVIDNYANGTITTVAGAQATATVNFAYEPHWRLSQWPGGTNLYICIRQFSLAPQTAAPATVGVLDCYYQDLITGFIIPLGDYLTNGPGNNSLDTLIPVPISDPDKQNGVGQLQVSLTASATTGVFNWQIAFSGAYLLPQMEGDELYERGGEYRHIEHEAHLHH